MRKNVTELVDYLSENCGRVAVLLYYQMNGYQKASGARKVNLKKFFLFLVLIKKKYNKFFWTDSIEVVEAYCNMKPLSTF